MGPVFDTLFKYSFIRKRYDLPSKSLQTIFLNSSEKWCDMFDATGHSIKLDEVSGLVARVGFYDEPSDKRRNNLSK